MYKSLFITFSAVNEHSRHELFNNIYNGLKKDNIDFRILSFSENEKYLPSPKTNFSFSIDSIGRKNGRTSAALSFIRYIKEQNPDHLLIGGYGYKENWIALFYSIYFNIPVTLWAGASKDTSESNSRIKKLLKSFFLKNVTNVIAYGIRSKKYLESLTNHKIPIRSGVNVSNTELFKKTLKNYNNSNEMHALTKKQPLATFIFVGRLEISKGVDIFINRLSELPYNKYFCNFVGDGSLRDLVEKSINEKKINAKYWGKLSHSEVAKRLVESNYYILPTLNDPFSRSLSEAISSGCFALNSKYDDASFDLIKNGENGFIFDPLNESEFRNYLNLFIESNWQKPSKETISKTLKYDTYHYSKQIIDSISEALK